VPKPNDVNYRIGRALRDRIEPLIGQVYFSPECHAAYAELGFAPSPAKAGAVELPDGVAYFTSRGSVMGQVAGEVVAAAFGVFNPVAVVPAVERGWQLTDAATICAARTRGAMAQLVRILGAEPEGVARADELLTRARDPLRPEGKALFAGLISQPVPEGGHLGRVWRLADELREYRGDAHIAAWTVAGFDATEIGLLTEPYWGLGMRTYVRTRAWTDADLDAAYARLAERGLVEGEGLSEEGRRQREEVERATDRQCRPIIDALGDDVEELLAILRPWGAAIRAAGGYPASGPHDLAAAR
jgi:hypothetical protein